MKKHLLFLLAISAIAGLSFKPHGKLLYNADTEKSTITWNAKKVTGEHSGTVKIKSGKLIAEHHLLFSGEFEMDMTSIACTDIKDAGMNTKLVNHLKSDDFFSVNKYPVSQLKIKSFIPVGNARPGEDNFNIKADLTIKGITREITFPAQITFNDNLLTAKASFKVDRTEFDVRYGSGKFFQNLGDKMIYDDFTISVNLVARPR